MIAPQAFFTQAGTPINVRLMVRALGELGHGVDLLTLPGGVDVAEPGLVIHRAPRLPVVTPAGGVPVGFSPAKLVYNPVLAGMATSMILRRRPLAVHAVEESAFWAVPLARRFGVPAVADLDSDLAALLAGGRSPLGRRLAGMARFLRRRALAGSTAIAAVARPLADLAWAEAPGVPVVLIPDIPLDGAFDPPDPGAVTALRAEYGLAAGEPVIAYTGNFDPRQGVAQLIEAHALLRRTHPAARLLLVGGGAGEIAALRRETAASDRVVFTGRLPAARMPAVMALAGVLVSPRLEPLITPLKIYTYMAAGRPIVATDLPTHTAVLDHTCAFLAAPTPAGLAVALAQALDDPAAAALRGAAARARVAERHSYARFKAGMAELYSHIPAPEAAPTAAPTLAAAPLRRGP
ncbi:MAG: hypothetical protein RLY86_1906 [Pseudomonadota bacterium]|jgi:glycosyltransferase involved in cell wall biosynthesis